MVRCFLLFANTNYSSNILNKIIPLFDKNCCFISSKCNQQLSILHQQRIIAPTRWKLTGNVREPCVRAVGEGQLEDAAVGTWWKVQLIHRWAHQRTVGLIELAVAGHLRRIGGLDVIVASQVGSGMVGRSAGDAHIELRDDTREHVQGFIGPS